MKLNAFLSLVCFAAPLSALATSPMPEIYSSKNEFNAVLDTFVGHSLLTSSIKKIEKVSHDLYVVEYILGETVEAGKCFASGYQVTKVPVETEAELLVPAYEYVVQADRVLRKCSR